VRNGLANHVEELLLAMNLSVPKSSTSFSNLLSAQTGLSRMSVEVTTIDL
jgi:hypothetical protein